MTDDKGKAKTIIIDGQYYYRLMDYFYIAAPADELNKEQVSALCHERMNKPECVQGANKIIKNIFNTFLIEYQHNKTVLEVGAGFNPILQNSEAEFYRITYSTSDADGKYNNISYKFDEETNLPDENFHVVIALFVLHFKFYPQQIEQIYKHLLPDGIFLANVYNRSDMARTSLKSDFEKAGFQIVLFKDPKQTCKEHYYLIASKDKQQLQLSKMQLLKIIGE